MSASPEDIALIKRQIEAQLDDYAREIAEFEAFMVDYRRRFPPRIGQMVDGAAA